MGKYTTYGPSNHHTSKVTILSLQVSVSFYYTNNISTSIGEGVFASGNLSKNWETFERLHQCTQWCKYYKLPRDYDECDGADTNLQLKLRDLKVQSAVDPAPEPPIEIDTDEHYRPAHPISPHNQNHQGQSNAMSLTSLVNPL